jgi:hypothetical protein
MGRTYKRAASALKAVHQVKILGHPQILAILREKSELGGVEKNRAGIHTVTATDARVML